MKFATFLNIVNSAPVGNQESVVKNMIQLFSSLRGPELVDKFGDGDTASVPVLTQPPCYKRDQSKSDMAIIDEMQETDSRIGPL